MILCTPDNTPIAAPQIENADTLLTDFRDFMRNINLSKDDMYVFLTTPSTRRDEFLKVRQSDYKIESNRFVVVNYL